MAGWSAICCAIDFSDASRFAMEEAADLARVFEAKLMLLHVHDTRPQLGAGAVEWSPLPFALAAVDLQRDICAWRCEAEERSGLKVCSVVLAGDPAVEIVRFARERGVDLLVVGKHGRCRLERLVLGSVAAKVVRNAPCPVMVVREKKALAYAISPVEQSAM